MGHHLGVLPVEQHELPARGVPAEPAEEGDGPGRIADLTGVGHVDDHVPVVRFDVRDEPVLLEAEVLPFDAHLPADERVRPVGADEIPGGHGLLRPCRRQPLRGLLEFPQAHLDVVGMIRHVDRLPAELDADAGMPAHRLEHRLLEFRLIKEVVRLPPRGRRGVPVDVEQQLAGGIDPVVVGDGNRLQAEGVRRPDPLEDPHDLMVEVAGPRQRIGSRPFVERGDRVPLRPEQCGVHLSDGTESDLNDIDIDHGSTPPRAGSSCPFY